MADEKHTLSGDQIAEMGLDDWTPIQGTLRARFTTGDFETGLKLVNAIGAAADEANHHPDLSLSYPHVEVVLTSHDVGGKTERDVALARRVSKLAAALGVSADPAGVAVGDLGLDTWDAEEIRGFWNAVYGLARDAGGWNDIAGEGHLPTIWFQQTDRHEPPRQRFHLDVWVDPGQAEPRIRAAVDAGGEVVDDTQAPRFTVLADRQGNKVCICTHRGRSH